MPTHEGSKRLVKVLIGAIVCLMLLAVFLARGAREERRAEATKLSNQHRIAIMKLEQERQKCAAQDACCSDKATLLRENLELQFQLQCHPKFGKDECDHAFLRAPEFDTAGVI